jgi:maltose O-acetyltransferase
LAWYRRLGAQIGPHTSIHRGCQFYAIENLQIGKNCVVNQNVFLDARRGLVVGKDVPISEQAVIYTLQHDLDDPDFSTEGGPVLINDFAFIGARAIILPNTTIGTGAAVGAGAVVTRDVPPYTVVGGVPAHVLRERSRDLRYRLDYRRRFF